MTDHERTHALIRRGLTSAMTALVVAADEAKGAEGQAVAGPANAAVSSTDAVSPRGHTATFSYLDEVALLGHQREAGLVYVSPGAGRLSPVLVVLHGINPKSEMYPWFGGTSIDLRITMDELVAQRRIEPLVVVAPSQTRNAGSGALLWPDFEPDVLLDGAERVLPDGVTLDRQRLVLAGHSGAGCNERGGLLNRSWRPADSPGVSRPMGVVALDTCLDETTARGLLSTAMGAPLFVYWQPFVWPRDVRGAEAVFSTFVSANPGAMVVSERIDEPSPKPHDAVVVLGLQRALERLLPASPPADEG